MTAMRYSYKKRGRVIANVLFLCEVCDSPESPHDDVIRRCNSCQSDWPDTDAFESCARCGHGTIRTVRASDGRNFRRWLDTVWPEDFREPR